MLRTAGIAAVLALAPLMLACGGSAATSETAAPSVVVPSHAAGASETKPAVASAPPSASVVENHTFASASLGVDKRYFVYLPAGYKSSAKRYPVIYMLHGLGGSESNWTKNSGLKATADKQGLQAIVVMPDGDSSFYSNNAETVPYDKCLKQVVQRRGKTLDMRTYCVKTPKYEDYIVGDLISHVDKTYRTTATRTARAIGGLSMGGFGALMLSMRHQDLFGAVASHAGVASLLYRGPDPYVKGKVQIADDPKPWIKRAGRFGVIFQRAFGTDIANWRAHDPSVLASKLENDKLAIYIDCGTEDGFKLYNGAQHLHDVLTTAGVAHRFHLVPGKHDTPFWSERLRHSLGFFADFFAGTQAP